MNQNLTVGINSDFSGLERGVASLFSQLGRIGQAAVQAGNQITGGFNRATTAANQYRDAQGRLREANGRFAGSSGNAFNSISKLTLGYFSATQALELLKQGLSIVSDFERLDGGLKAVSSSAIDFASTQSFLRRQADQLGLSYEVLAGTYKGLKAATNDTALAGAETERIFTSVVRAGAALRLSNEQVEGTLLAIQQMLSKGVVSMEELRQQLGERLPAAFGLAAKAMGVSTAELNKMVASGNVLAIDLLPKLATELEKAYGAQAQANVNSMAGGFTRATDQLKLFVSEFAKTAGIDSFFGKIGNGIANIIKDLRRAQNGDLQTNYDDFLGLSLPEKEKELSRLGGEINRAQARLNTLAGSAPTDKNLKAETALEKQIETMKRLYGAYYLAVRDGQNAAAKAAGVGTTKTFDIESAKNRQSELAKGIATARLNGQNPVALQREYDQLTARIDAATASTKRHAAAHVAAEPTITTNERLLRMYSQRMRELGDAAPAALTRTVGLLQDAVDKEKSAVKGAIDLGNALRQIKNPGASTARVGQILSGNGASLNGLNGSTAAIGLPGLGNYQMEQSNFMRDLQEQTRGKVQAIRAAMSEIPSSFNSIKAEMNQLVAEDPFNTKGLIDKVFGSADALAQAVQSAKLTMAGAFGDMLAGFAQSVGQGQNAFGQIIGSLISTIADGVIQLGKTLIMLAIPMLGAVVTAPLAIKQMITGGAIIAAGGLAKGLAAQVFSSKSGGGLPAFAKGVTSFGTTVGVFGEYPGASRNPEFTAPVNIGANLIGDRLAKMGAFGGGGMAGGEFVVRGTDLVLVLQRAGTTKLNFGS